MVDPSRNLIASLPEGYLARAVSTALQEDIGTGDVTSQATIKPDALLEGEMLSKEAGVVAGLFVAREVFAQVDPLIVFEQLIDDGTLVEPGTILARVRGKGPSLLTAERVALNFLQRMSGIASMTRRYQEAIAGTGATVLDTRKTAPGLRLLDKLAVRLGGGGNHRIGLYDMVLIKDNHILAAGGIAAAVAQARAYPAARDLKIEVEVENLAQLDEALALGVDRVMLDNMDVATMHEAVRRASQAVELEASGGITLDTIRSVAETGVDFISVGALTHSVVAMDISLDLCVTNEER
ncbi:MAG: carboxylating nicotinate-nucleotide diphosphorylase [Anaerolineae bacterium]